LKGLALTEIELPWILGGASTSEALATMKESFARGFAHHA
jgi:hypothetical protein